MEQSRQKVALYYRKSAGLSQEVLAERIGVTREFLARLEVGSSFPSINTLIDVANALNISTDLFLQDYLNDSLRGNNAASIYTVDEDKIISQTVSALRCALADSRSK
nr:helix-turn-helix transcriptional regulator [Butyrivibrio sp. FC2001]